MTMRLWLSPEQSETLLRPVGKCYHARGPRGAVVWMGGVNKSTHGILMCLGCGTEFEFLGHTDASVTDEDEAIEINRTRT